MARSGWARALALAAIVSCLWTGGASAGTCTLPAFNAAAPLALDVYGAAAAGCNGLFYEGGGYSFTTSSYTNAFRSWNPTNNTWTSLATIPSTGEMMSFACDAVGNRILAFGGIDVISIGTAYNLTRIYSIATNTWSSGPPMGVGRQQMASAVVGNLVYLAGGYTDGFINTLQTTNEEYNLTTNTFATRAPMPQGLGGGGGGTSGGMFYVMGGRDQAVANRNSNYEYNPVTNTWATRANLPTGVNVPGSASLSGAPQCQGDIILLGGGNPFIAATPEVNPSKMPEGARAMETTNITQIYNAATNTWMAGPSLLQGRSFIAASQAADALLAAGGYTGVSTTANVDRIQGPPLPVDLGGFAVE